MNPEKGLLRIKKKPKVEVSDFSFNWPRYSTLGTITQTYTTAGTSFSAVRGYTRSVDTNAWYYVGPDGAVHRARD